MFDADSAVFGVEAHQADPTVAGNTLFGDLQAFVESHGVQQFFPPAATAARKEDVDDNLEAPSTVFEMFELPTNEGMMRVPTEAKECFNNRVQRLEACQGIGNGEFAKFFKANQQLMQTHANEPRPNPSAFEGLHAAIEKTRALEQEHSAEIVQQACQLLESIETKLRGTEDTGVSSHCLDVYKLFQALIEKLSEWDWFKYDRKSDSYYGEYDKAYRNVERLMNNRLNQGRTDAQRLSPKEVVQCQEIARALGPLLEKYSQLWKNLDG